MHCSHCWLFPQQKNESVSTHPAWALGSFLSWELQSKITKGPSAVCLVSLKVGKLQSYVSLLAGLSPVFLCGGDWPESMVFMLIIIIILSGVCFTAGIVHECLNNLCTSQKSNHIATGLGQLSCVLARASLSEGDCYIFRWIPVQESVLSGKGGLPWRWYILSQFFRLSVPWISQSP